MKREERLYVCVRACVHVSVCACVCVRGARQVEGSGRVMSSEVRDPSKGLE